MIGGAIPPRMAVNDGAEEPKVPRTPNPSLVDLLNYQNSPMVSSVGLLTPDLNQRLVLSTPQEVNWEVDSQHVDMVSLSTLHTSRLHYPLVRCFSYGVR